MLILLAAGLPEPPFEAATLLVGPLLPPLVGALLLLVVGAGAMVLFYLENGCEDWTGRTRMRSDLDHGNLELFDVQPRLLAPHVAEAQTRRARI